MIGNASAFRVNSDQGLKYYNSSSAEKSQLNVTPDGILDVNQIGTSDKPVGTLHSESINADEMSRKTESVNYSDQNPLWPRQPEQGGPIHVREYPGVDNPILSMEDVEIATSGGVADPLIRWMPELGKYVIFAEVYPEGEQQDIAYWTSATPTVPDSWTWGARLNLASHATSFPYTFKYENKWYMAASSAQQNNGVKIWELDAGEPSTTADLANWSIVESKMTDHAAKDNVIFEFNDKWWTIFRNQNDSSTYIYYADAPVGETWTAHPSNPVMMGRADGTGRVPGGTPIVREHSIDFIDHVVSIDTITDLTTTSFSYTENTAPAIATLTQNGGWNSDNMHTLDVCMNGPAATSNPIVITDGIIDGDYGTGLYTVTDLETTSATLYASSATTLTSGAYTTVTLDAVDHDVANNTGADKYTIPTTGYYQISGQVMISNAQSTTPFHLLAQVVVGGVGPVPATEVPIVVSGENRSIPLPPITKYLQSGSSVTLRVFNRGGSDETTATGLNNTFLSVRRIPE